MAIKRYLSVCLVLLFALTSINSQANYDSEIAELARRLNVWRTSLGLGPLVFNPTLERMAATQADFLIRQPSLPGDIHAGAQGEYPRERSQFPEFAWPTYGHPQRMSVTEIAAIGSINSAISFWMGSDIHNRSVTNPAYREVGITARQYGSDIMFIVVLGGRPDYLPVLLDVEGKTLYLTTEKIEWAGEWVGEVTDYRFLDADEQLVTDWTPWERLIDFSEDEELEAQLREAVYIQYRDAQDNRAQFLLDLDPAWSDLPEPNTSNLPTPIPTGTPLPEGFEPTPTGIFVTNTPIVTPSPTYTPEPTLTPFPTLTPTPTPRPGTVELIYTDNVFTLYNSGATSVDLSGIRFDGNGNGFVGTFWEEVSSILNLSALPASECLVIEPEDGLSYAYPPQCTNTRSIVQEPDPRYFWLADFEVSIEGEVIATCSADADSCTLNFN